MDSLRVRAIIEILGTPKDHVEETMQKVLDLIKKSENMELISHDIAETQEIENIWSTFGEFELEFQDIDKLTDFCFEFMPSSIEILEPEDLVKVKTKKLEGLFNDMLTKVHHYDMTLKKIMLGKSLNLKKANEKKEN